MSMTNREARMEKAYAALTPAEQIAVEAYLAAENRPDISEPAALATAYRKESPMRAYTCYLTTPDGSEVRFTVYAETTPEAEALVDPYLRLYHLAGTWRMR